MEICGRHSSQIVVAFRFIFTDTDNGIAGIRYVIESSSVLYRTYFGFYTIDDHSFSLAIVFLGPQPPVIWSANPDSPVSHDATLNFTREGGLVLNDGDGTMIWSTATKGQSVAGMSLDVSGNLVLFDHNNFTAWQSFDHPTDTVVMGQSLCRGKNLSARTSTTKWSSARVYLSAQWDGLHYSFEPAAYTKLFQITATPTSRPSTCYEFINGSFGFPGFSLISVLLCAAKRCKKDEEQLLDGIIPGITKRFSFDELKVATGHFSTKLGGGGFGSVFKGKIGGETIAVKRLEGVEQGMEEFSAEVKTIGRIHHLNLVRLVGFCAEKSNKLLVYEYLSNGSLDKWISQRNPVFTLCWAIRRKIVIAIARSLAYLHEECEEKIAHLDIKPQNILLDDKFNAKLSDFGLSKMINRDKSKVMTRMRGTRGYLAPEWLGSTITEKADIYSFGIVMIEIICGRENLDESQPDESIHLISLLQEKARSGQLSDLVDRRSMDMQLHMEEVMQMMKLAMWCLQVDSSRRPLMSTVAKVLEGVMSLETTVDYTFVPSFAVSNTDTVDSSSLYRPSELHLSGPSSYGIPPGYAMPAQMKNT
ncbi:hypothetical protein EJB05_15644 [Eragrostis curvula]|uniref:non-specific serine/threonine protein kinase n=1 Tax=Eragrostis curvula TaxID=38414 RepID=A0A5J9VCP4_9POAL|nr:hypothetical protein EJB05_15644 [Eragrostis curvula]